jgi:Tat protein translocase TatB subunit
LEVFGIGLPELMLIAVVALIVLGPERLPEAARAVGKGVADLRRAVEPARSAWNDLTGEITNVGATVSSATSSLTTTAGARSTVFKPTSPGERSTAITTENPWQVHPIMANMTEEERETFMRVGEVPPRILEELSRAEAVHSTNGKSVLEGYDIVDIEYPMPHAEIPSEPAPPHQPVIDEIAYPEPGNTTTKEKENEQDT